MKKIDPQLLARLDQVHADLSVDVDCLVDAVRQQIDDGWPAVQAGADLCLMLLSRRSPEQVAAIAAVALVRLAQRGDGS
jgi:hypothetical protein